MLSPLVSAREIAPHLKVGLPRVYALARRGLIPFVRVGGRYRFSPDAVDDWIRAGGSALPAEKREA
jgi:excisionase family DNA binding protein